MLSTWHANHVKRQRKPLDQTADLLGTGAAPWLACSPLKPAALPRAADPTAWHAAAVERLIASQRRERAQLCAAAPHVDLGTTICNYLKSAAEQPHVQSQDCLMGHLVSSGMSWAGGT